MEASDAEQAVVCRQSVCPIWETKQDRMQITAER